MNKLGQDRSIPDSPELTASILDVIDESIARGARGYLHCCGGIGRTGLIVGCWVERRGFPEILALDRLREFWRQCPKSAFRRSPETREQEH